MGQAKTKRSVYVIVWEFRVRPGSEPAFEAAFGASGAWTKLMRSADGYLGSDLIRGDADPSRYLTVDRWRSPRAFEHFRTQRTEEYEALDAELGNLVEHERQIGDFVVAEGEAG